MNQIIITELMRLIKEHGEAAALSDVLDAIDTALGPQSENAELIRATRDQICRRNMSLHEIVAEDTRANLAALRFDLR